MTSGRAIALAAALAAALVAGCGDNLSIAHDGPPPTDETLFDETRVWDVEIELGLDAIRALEDEPFTYVHGDVTVGGVRFADAGVRLKGSFSFRSLSGKAAFKIRLDRFVPGQGLGTLRRLTLNNMWQSRGMLSEWLGYQVYAAAGVPAPRCGFARVWVNGELFGLYADVETEDVQFLARHFGDAGGNLYEAELTDVTAGDIDDFEQEQGEDTSRDDLAELAAAVAAGDGIFYDEPALLDTDAFLALVASDALIGNWDGYWKAHNYRLYRDPSDGRWRFLPWGIDQSFERRLDPFSGEGAVTRACIASDRCLPRYATSARALAETIEAGDLSERLDQVARLIDPDVDDDPRKPYGAEKIRRHQAAIRDLLHAVPGDLAERTACADDEAELDRDGDGYGGCLEDCDDTSDDAHPGGHEECDGLDNDCDQLIDELPGCGCEEVDVGGRAVLLCDNPMSWSAAEAHCAAQGAELAWFADADESRAVFAVARDRRRDHWYFALNDRLEEGRWQAGGVDAPWGDWASDEPDSFGEEDCAVLDQYADGAWSDVRCGEAHPFVCTLPP